MRKSLVVFAMSCLLVGCSTKQHIVDLTHRVGNDFSVTYPGYPDFNHTVLTKGKQSTGIWMMSGWFSVSEHAGTHMDAPAHYSIKGLRMDEVPLEELIGPGVVINIKERALRDADAEMELVDLKEWEAEYGVIPNGAFVLVNSGWGKKYPNKTKIFGTPHHNDVFSTKYHHPGVTPEAARWLIEHRDISGLRFFFSQHSPAAILNDVMAHHVIHLYQATWLSVCCGVSASGVVYVHLINDGEG